MDRSLCLRLNSAARAGAAPASPVPLPWCPEPLAPRAFREVARLISCLAPRSFVTMMIKGRIRVRGRFSNLARTGTWFPSLPPHVPALAEEGVPSDVVQLKPHAWLSLAPVPTATSLGTAQGLWWTAVCHGNIRSGAPVLRVCGVACSSGSPGEKGHELTWFPGSPGPRAGAEAGRPPLPGFRRVPVLAGSVVMLGAPSCLPGAAGRLNAQGSGKLWCPLGGSASVVPTPAGHPIFLQVREPRLSLQALLAAALLGLQGQAPVAPIRDREGAGGRCAFAGPQGWRGEVGAQHGAAAAQGRREAGAGAGAGLELPECALVPALLGAVFGSLQPCLPQPAHRAGAAPRPRLPGLGRVGDPQAFFLTPSLVCQASLSRWSICRRKKKQRMSQLTGCSRLNFWDCFRGTPRTDWSLGYWSHVSTGKSQASVIQHPQFLSCPYAT